MTKTTAQDWLEALVGDAAVAAISAHVAAEVKSHVSARGAAGSSTNMLAAALQKRLRQPVLLVVAHIDEVDDAVDELEAIGLNAVGFPAVEHSPGESGINQELLGERLIVVRQLAAGVVPDVIVAAIPALMQSVPGRDEIGSLLRTVKVNDTLELQEFLTWLTEAGYSRVSTIESPGEFAVRGGIIDVFPLGAAPVRLDLSGDNVEHIAEIDLDSMGSDRRVERVNIVSGKLSPSPPPPEMEKSRKRREVKTASDVPTLMSYLPANTIAVLAELLELNEQGRSYYDRALDASRIVDPASLFRQLRERAHAFVEVAQFSGGAASDPVVPLPVQALPMFDEDVSAAIKELASLSTGRVIVCCQNDGEASRLGELLHELKQTEDGASLDVDHVEIEVRYLSRGFVWGACGDTPPPSEGGGDGGNHRHGGYRAVAASLAIVPYHELLHRTHLRRRVRRLGSTRALDAFLDLQPGDYVVHRDHGIARFAGLQEIVADKNKPGEEYLTLEFAGSAKLHVPVSKIELVQRYVGAMTGSPTLSTLGGKKWSNQKEQAAEAVRDLAADMLRLQAAREALPGIRYPQDTAWQLEFDAEFPYDETDDQLAAIAAAKRDMSSPRPMDRLVCGDVGFGKTEVAMRAAFKAVEFGKQVAVLVPTTVLAAQHERTFHDRFSGYPFAIESISRFRTKKEQTEILHRLSKGQIDIIIGTHRLLSRDVRFADLGLVIVDEEQRFGVEHKHRLLELRTEADVMTLSATPIPRTLHMAMLGLRDISSLSTPPLDRRAIVTEVLAYESTRIKQAIRRELAREGQVYFVHNRVHNIEALAHEIQALVPDARVIVGHGQMGAGELERVMLKFLRRDVDVLVCTTIIESGIDIPTANTMFINNAHNFGLSELHQLRGRVGRSKHRAYCYMLLPADRVLSEVALKRMRAIESFSMLGAGFRIALRDLEIRGAGNLLGAEQSGHIAAVGYEMYCQLLEHAVGDLKHQPVPRSPEAVIELGVTGALPRGYIPSDVRRMDAYRRIARAHTPAALEAVRHDLVSAYGDLPRSAEMLMDVADLRISAARLSIRSMVRHEDDIIITTTKPQSLEEQMAGATGTLRAVGTPDENGRVEVYYRPPRNYLQPETLLRVLLARLAEGDGSPEKQRKVASQGPRLSKP
jgi:transcription-repair coupling factor (superfamily II helicase)